MQPTDDSALLRQFAEGQSDEAFAALVTRHINLVYSVAMRLVGQPQDAEEIAQAVFIILAKKAVRLRHERALTSWLFQTTRLTANNFVRSEMRRRHREQEAFMRTVLDESSPDIWPKIAPLLDNAIAGLREKDRQAILLRFFEGRNLREIGSILGTSEAAAEKRVSRALEKLRKFFAKRGVDSTVTAIAENISAHSIQVAPVALAKSVTAAALAKGAAASVSTLTLIKGAWKVMAWTKMKMAIGVGVGILLVTGMTTLLIQKESGSQAKMEQPMASKSPVAEPLLAAWQNGDKIGAIGKFVGADWTTRPLFATNSVLSLSEKEFAVLTDAERQAALNEFNGRLAALKQVAAAVAQAGRDMAANGDNAQARKYFTALNQCGTALDSAECLQIVQLVGKAFKKMSDTELSKLGQ
ncbi:MAG TPA: sigma-70 family RNA polymerase sigma factor [Verrucomicrobiae bacterium]|nr:sigma-70 family RNA polymerase sigma factor [Verrucomicrobiae bacterium]